MPSRKCRVCIGSIERRYRGGEPAARGFEHLSQSSIATSCLIQVRNLGRAQHNNYNMTVKWAKPVTGPITLIAGAQTMLTTPNFFRLEIAYSELEVYQQVMDPPFDVRAGFFHVYDRPGLGHELREDYLQQAIPF